MEIVNQYSPYSNKKETENEVKSFLGFALRDNEKRKNYLFLVKSLVIDLFKNAPIFPVLDGLKKLNWS